MRHNMVDSINDEFLSTNDVKRIMMRIWVQNKYLFAPDISCDEKNRGKKRVLPRKNRLKLIYSYSRVYGMLSKNLVSPVAVHKKV